MNCYILDTGEVMSIAYVSPLDANRTDLANDLYSICVQHDRNELDDMGDVVKQKIDSIMSYGDYVWWNGFFTDLMEAEELQASLKERIPDKLYKEVLERINDEFLYCELSERPHVIKEIVAEYEG